MNEQTDEEEIKIGAGKYFGEMAIMQPFPGVRTASIKAKTDCSLAALERDAFLFVL